MVYNKNSGLYYFLEEDELEYKDNLNAGMATVIINSDKIDGTLEKTFDIKPYSFSFDATFVATGSSVYTGSKVEPEGYLEVNLNGKKVALKKGVDYKLRSYKFAINAGTAMGITLLPGLSDPFIQ